MKYLKTRRKEPTGNRTRILKPLPFVVLMAALYAPSALAADVSASGTISGATATDSTAYTTTGSDITVTVGGNITANANSTDATAIIVNTSGVTIDNDKTIKGTGAAVTNDGVAIQMSGSGANTTINNTGTITSDATNGDGILAANGANGTVINNRAGGVISRTGGTDGVAIGLQSNANTVNNDGTITATVADSDALLIYGNNNTINNNVSGIISRTHGSDSVALGIGSGTGNVINNEGLITNTGANGDAIIIETAASNNTINNKTGGTISTTSTGGVAVGLKGTGNTVINNAGAAIKSTSSAGDEAAIAIQGDSNTITNYGTISAAGSEAAIIVGDVNDTTINVKSGGSVTVSKSGTAAIDTSNVSAGKTVSITVEKGGKVAAASASETAIQGGAGNEAVNLYYGSTVLGKIDLGTGTDTVNYLSSGSGAAAATSSTTVIPSGVTVNLGSTSGLALTTTNGAGDTVVVSVDTTNFSAAQTTIANAASNISQAVSAQLSSPVAMYRSVKVASVGSDAGIWSTDTRPMAWGRLFGKYTSQEQHGESLGFGDHTYGVIGGYEQSLGDHRVGLFGGVTDSDTKVAENAGRTTGNGIFAGMYGQYVMNAWRFSGSLAIGYNSYDNERNVIDNLNGAETATADYHAWYVSPTVNVAHVFELGGGTSLTPSAQVSYTYADQSGYTENGTTNSNLTVGTRKAEVLNTRLQLASRNPIMNNTGAVELRGGWSYTSYGNDSSTVGLQGGTPTQYNLSGAEDQTGAFVGSNVSVQYAKNLNLVGDIELYLSDGDDYSVMAYGGLEYKF